MSGSSGPLIVLRPRMVIFVVFCGSLLLLPTLTNKLLVTPFGLSSILVPVC